MTSDVEPEVNRWGGGFGKFLRDTAEKIAQHPTKVAKIRLKHVKVMLLFFWDGGRSSSLGGSTAPLAPPDAGPE